MYCKYCGSELLPDARFCPRCGAAALSRADATVQSAPPEKKMRMGWYGFLACFYLPFFGIVTGIGNAFTFVNDYFVRLASGRDVQTAFTSLVADYRADLPAFVLRTILTLLNILLAFYALSVFSALRRYARNAGAGVTRFFIFCAALSVLSAISLMLSGDGIFMMQRVSVSLTAVLCVVAAICSHAFFKHRADRFVNE